MCTNDNKKKVKKNKRAEKQTLLPHKRSGNGKKERKRKAQHGDDTDWLVVVASHLWTIAQCDTVSPAAAAALRPQSVRFDRLSVNNMPCGHISLSLSLSSTEIQKMLQRHPQQKTNVW